MDQWLELPANPRRRGQPHRLKQFHRATRLTAVVLLWVYLFLPLVSGCGYKAPDQLTGPGDEGVPPAGPPSLVPGAGQMHNLIVEKTLAALPALSTLQTLSEGRVSRGQIRRALRAATREAFAEQPSGASGARFDLARERQLDEVLDDAHLDLLERRFRSLKALLVRAEAPPANELEALFASWGIAPAEAHQAALFARLALNPTAHSTSGGTVTAATAETCSAAAASEATSSDPTSELRELAATSPTLGMVYELYHSSASLWQGVSSQSSYKEEKLELTLTIVMDAEGGLGGLLFGPIGAILGSAVYSILWVATAP